MLEEHVVGIKHIDLELLKRKTKYTGYTENANSVVFFWKVLENVDNRKGPEEKEKGQKDLANFLRFVWGRSRLPAEDSPHWGTGFEITKAAMPADSCPVGHT